MTDDSFQSEGPRNSRSVGGISKKGEAHRARGMSLGRALPPRLECFLGNMKIFLNVCLAHSQDHRGTFQGES